MINTEKRLKLHYNNRKIKEIIESNLQTLCASFNLHKSEKYYGQNIKECLWLLKILMQIL